MHRDTRVAFGTALAVLGERIDFAVLDSDLSKATQTKVFKEKFPDRFFNMGIAEQDMMATAAGIASCGMPVVASSFAMFATGRAYEQVRNAIAYPNRNVKIVATHGGILIGEDGASHQCIEDISLMRTLPNMTVIVPADAYSTEKALAAALQIQGPVYMRLGRTSSLEVYTAASPFTIGKGNVLRDGNDIAIFAIGDMVYEALQSAQQLSKRGIQCAVIDLHTIKPIDEGLIKQYAEKCRYMISVEDHLVIGGLGSAICEVLGETRQVKIRRHGVQDRFGKSGKREDLMKEYGLCAESITQDILAFMEEGR